MYNVIGFVWIDKVSMCSDGQPRQTWKWEKRGGRGTASPAILVARDWVARVNQTEVASSGDGRTEVSEKNKRGTGSRPGVVPHRIYAAGELKSSMILCSWERICTDLNSHISNPLSVPGNGVSHKRPHTHKSRETVNRPQTARPERPNAERRYLWTSHWPSMSAAAFETVRGPKSGPNGFPALGPLQLIVLGASCHVFAPGRAPYRRPSSWSKQLDGGGRHRRSSRVHLGVCNAVPHGVQYLLPTYCTAYPRAAQGDLHPPCLPAYRPPSPTRTIRGPWTT